MPATIYGIPSLVIIWGGMMIIMVIGAILFAIVKNNKHKAEKARFFKKHPDASKVYEKTDGVVVSGGVEIHTVDGEIPISFVDGLKVGKYIAPGEHKIQISASHTRPGIVYKTVTKTTGTIDKIINVEPNSEYELAYDRKTKEFSLNKKED